jgi:transcriptional regulator with XRE-family HTH domain
MTVHTHRTAPTQYVEANGKRRLLGVTFEQVAKYLGWDAGSLRRYLNGTWRISPGRADALEEFLGLRAEAAPTVLAMPRPRR